MRNFFKKIVKFKTISAVFLLSFLFIVGGWLWAFFALRKISQPLIIHFNDVLHINQVGSLNDLTIVALFGLISLVLDFLIALELEERDWFLGKLTAAFGLFFSVLLFIGFAAIISVN